MSESGSTTVRFEQHSDFPHHASFSPNGVHLASCSDDGAIKVCKHEVICLLGNSSNSIAGVDDFWQQRTRTFSAQWS